MENIRLYRYNEVPLKEVGLTRKTKQDVINNTLSEVLHIFLDKGYLDFNDVDLVKIFFSSNTAKKIKDYSTGWYAKPSIVLYDLLIAELTNDIDTLNDIGYDEYLVKIDGVWWRA